ncbi:cache domain-containing sensor histidine kinase [Paenibacillus radicis (ex Xue et al. 2023)]|uniref:histidine kinase n=1 Tax=Paenibacillus radicis (ex Xue et al. 2023) TaxID=2972489 RepID=A0ABT1YIQ0_9BACL|nr:sensor histidine kinase [Paenibacillus radicis (ex Xue et al. 2023)]MCR8633064.1 cache domain-containing protein [Paenibacillus radicis (ex Xue et al. 2023)]
MIKYASLRKLSIKMKMVLAFLSVSMLSVLLLGLFSNYYYSRAAEKEFFTISNEATARLNYHLDYYYQQLQQSTHSLIQNDIIQEWLTSQSYTNVDIQNIEKEMRRYLALNYSEIQGLFLISKSNQIVSMAQYFGKLDRFVDEPWYGVPASSKVLILPTHTAKYEGAYGRPVMSMLMPIYNKETIELIGTLAVDISLQEIDRSFKVSKLGGSGFFFIVSDNGSIVYHPNEEWNGIPMSQTELASLRIPENTETSIQQFRGESYLLGSSRSPVTGWRIVSLVPFAEVAVGLSSARFSTLWVLGIITLLVILVVPLLSNRFVNPILTLRGLMRQVSKGNLSVQTESVPGQDELQQLFHSFNVMVKRLDELIVTNSRLQMKEMQALLKQKETLIKALQNQINPHLLYNTLGIITSMAYLEKVPIIERMARNLSDVYRYTAKFTDMEVKLEDELGQLRKYLDIIHVRFPKHFQSRFFINDKFISCRVVKLILQPIVENAVKYAIEPRGGEGVVIISAYDEGSDLIIEVADNGPGIEETELLRITQQLEGISTALEQNEAQQDSLGIANVHARLVLQYGIDYGVKLTSFPGRGTVVSIRIPIHLE